MRPAGSIVSYLPTLPIDFFRWWFFEATGNLVKILIWIFRAIIQLLSIESIFKTFFKPWKNEYREGLTRFSVFFGIGFKSLFLIFDFFLLLGLAITEVFVLIAWVLLPVFVIWGFYAQFFL